MLANICTCFIVQNCNVFSTWKIVLIRNVIGTCNVVITCSVLSACNVVDAWKVIKTCNYNVINTCNIVNTCNFLSACNFVSTSSIVRTCNSVKYFHSVSNSSYELIFLKIRAKYEHFLNKNTSKIRAKIRVNSQKYEFTRIFARILLVFTKLKFF